jgi:hypothetical protein
MKQQIQNGIVALAILSTSLLTGCGPKADSPYQYTVTSIKIRSGNASYVNGGDTYEFVAVGATRVIHGWSVDRTNIDDTVCYFGDNPATRTIVVPTANGTLPIDCADKLSADAEWFGEITEIAKH